MIKITPETVAAVTVAGIVVYALLKREAADAAEAVGDAIDPTSRDNIFYRGVNAVGESVSGEPGWTLGGWIYDITHTGTPE